MTDTSGSAPPPNDHTHFTLSTASLRLETASDLEPHLGSLLDSPSTITTLSLGGNTLSSAACEALSTRLLKLTNLRVANLDDIFTSRLLTEIPPALTFLLDALLTLPHLHTVNLSDNAFGLNTVGPLVTFLSQHSPLQHLILNNNGLGPRAGGLVADALCALAKCKAAARTTIPPPTHPIPNLETVICGRNRLETGSMLAWARVFAEHPHVRTVRMIQNGIHVYGIEKLFHNGIFKATDLEVLDLQDNTFTLVAARVIAKGIPLWPHLRELGIGDCLMGSSGSERVIRSLIAAQPPIEVLRLQYNELSGKGLAVLAHGLEHGLEKLRRVELNGNRFDEDDEALMIIRGVLEKRKTEHVVSSDEHTHDHRDATGEWGLDDLSDLEEEESEDEDEDEEDEDEDEDEVTEQTTTVDEVEKKAEKVVKEADDAETENVTQKKDGEVDALADKMGKTSL